MKQVEELIDGLYMVEVNSAPKGYFRMMLLGDVVLTDTPPKEVKKCWMEPNKKEGPFYPFDNFKVATNPATGKPWRIEQPEV